MEILMDKKRFFFLFLLIFLLDSYAFSLKNFTFSGEVRWRFEFLDNFDFKDELKDQDGIHLFRTRLNFEYFFSMNFLIKTQFQDSRVCSLSYGSRDSYEDSLDLRELYFKYKDDKFSFSLGRMEFFLGDERLVGPVYWSNVSQSFDGLNFNFLKNEWNFKLFALRKVLIEDGKFNKWDEDDNFFGTWTSKKVTNYHDLNLFLFYRDTSKPVSFGSSVGSAEMKEYTAGFQFEGKDVKGFDYLLFGAYQFGDFGEKDISAKAFAFTLNYNFKTFLNPKIGIEFDWGSGDKNPLDNKRETFDNLYPTGHKFYGYMDRASLQNLKSYAFHLFLDLSKDSKLEISYHNLNLDTSADSMYLASRKPFIQGIKGQSTKIGDEIDLALTHKLNKNLNFLLGYSYLMAGKFLKQNERPNDAEYFYFQSIIKF